MTQYSVLIVEDDQQASYTLEQAVNQHPLFKVIAAAESVAETRMHLGQQPDLILLDITLPDGDGMSLLRDIRQQGLSASVIMTTAERESSMVAQAIQFGVNDYLVKPLRLSRVHQALNDFVAFQAKLEEAEHIDQLQIDDLMRKSKTPSKSRKTPKGIDATTLSTMVEHIKQRQEPFSAQEIGDELALSRITARRYLEYLEEQGMVSMSLNYNTGGRPKQLYHVVG
ncbi:Transcriptional regulatory protein DpiA [Marinomonas aquimarina]|uniref:Transcriptional regulatory protein n=1 Tax=Marinomonas aquimarina TaxID=295068 RepID=A0A1A8TKJ3_9GAMM|nr:response regulator [Marinomonas aquimarina]SBS33203.1 Transcriptional regulatory protein DpiA [Marinomonas aquimarina]